MSETTTKTSKKSIILKSLFIVMILAIIVLLAFAVIRFVPFLFSSFASVGNAFKSGSDMEIRLSENDLNSNDNFRLYWEYSGPEEGSYNLKYECAPNLKLLVGNDEGTELECDRNYPLSKSDSFIDLVAVSTRENTYTESEITVSIVNAEEEVASASEAFSITNEGDVPINDLSGGATISSQDVTDDSDDGSNNTQDNSGSNNNQNNSGTNNNVSPTVPADLAIFNVRAISDTRVVFDVSNIGGRSSGNWYFAYTIPGEGIETSPLQLSLNSGDTIRYTLTYEDIESGDSVISVDPLNRISESSENNNVVRVFVEGDGGKGSPNNNYDPDDEADLVIENLEAGYMSGSRFREDDDIDDNDDAAVRFTVTNIGGENTGRWRFSIDETPYDGSDNDYESGRQDSLRPGESVEIIVEFENPDEGNYDIEVEVDSDDDVDEENESNNDDSVDLRVRD